jgi:hypothetical protein
LWAFLRASRPDKEKKGRFEGIKAIFIIWPAVSAWEITQKI